MKSKFQEYIGRIVVILTAIYALALTIIPIITDADWNTRAGTIAATLAIIPVVITWLKNLGQHELDEKHLAFTREQQNYEEEDDGNGDAGPGVPELEGEGDAR